eukprot:SAG31_NODE_35585_length_321_cov_1.779279_1_plen_56_part_10
MIELGAASTMHTPTTLRARPDRHSLTPTFPTRPSADLATMACSPADDADSTLACDS